MVETTWQVMPGVGEQYLKTIGQEARLWHFFANRKDSLTDQAVKLGLSSSLLGEEALNAALMDGSMTDFESLTLKLDEEQEHEVALASLASMFIRRATSLEYMPSLDPGNRARLTVIKSGVYAKRFATKAVPDAQRLAEAPKLEIEQEVEGTIWNLRLRPAEGGVIGLSKKGWSATYIRGLVNPLTGDPRVQLEVLGKTPKS
jgi:hypothetical protein